MPIFEHKCPKCGKVIEVIEISNKEAIAPKCDICGIVMEKVEFSLSGFQLVGKGWFKTGGY